MYNTNKHRVNSTVAENTAIVIDSDSNTLMYYTDIHEPTKASGLDANPSFRRTLFLDDTTNKTNDIRFKSQGIFLMIMIGLTFILKSQSKP